MKYVMGNRRTSSQSRCVPYCAPAWMYVDTAPASLSASITIRPGPKTIRKVSRLRAQGLRTTTPRVGVAGITDEWVAARFMGMSHRLTTAGHTPPFDGGPQHSSIQL